MNSEKIPKPGRSGIGPDWWHNHGIKMKIRKRENRADPFIIESGAAYLEITRGGGYTVRWRVTHNPSSHIEGTLVFSEREFKQAFALSEKSGESGEGILAEYGGTAASQGSFIRYENYLNIPCPGTGRDGDPNISILLNEEIKKEAKNFLDGD